MALDRLTKITGPGVSTDTNWVGNNANFTGITTAGSSFNIGVTTIHSTLAEVHNIKSTGILTATGGSFSGNVTAVDGTFSGNVSIGGTLTYEDVTNIDSVGIITARDDIKIIADNKKLKLGVGEELQLYQSGNHSVIQHNGSHYLSLRSNAFIVQDAAATKSMFFGDPNGQSALYFNGSKKLNTTNGGCDITGALQVDALHCLGQINLDSDIDVEGHTNLDNVSISGVTTHQGNIKLPDDAEIILGNDDDFKIQHSSGNVNFILSNTNRQLQYKSDGGFLIRGGGNQMIANFLQSAVTLYQGQQIKLTTVDKGITVGTGVTVETNGQATFTGVTTFTHSQFDDYIRIGNPAVLGSNTGSQIGKGEGATRPASLTFNHGGSATLELGSVTAAAIIGTNSHGANNKPIRFMTGMNIGTLTGGSIQMEIKNNAVNIFNDLDVDGHTNLDNVSIAGVTTAAGNINMGGGNLIFGDSGGDSDDKLVFGAGSDLKIFHNGSNNYIDVAGDGHLYIRPKANFYIQDYTNGEVWIDGTLNGGVKLYDNGIQRFETYSSGATVNGPTLNISPSSGNANLVLKSGSGSVYTNIHFKANDNTLTSYITSWSGGTLFLNGTSLIRSSIAGTEITEVASTGFHPVTDSARDLGLNAKRWRNVYADTLYGDGSNLTGISAGTSLSGSTNNTVCTVTGANAIQGESTLTYDGTTLKNLIDVPGTTPTIAEFRSSTSLYGGGIRIRTNNSWGLVQLTNNALNSFASLYNSTGGWHWDSNMQFHGSVTPWTDGNLNLGASNKRWANVYTTDLQLSNEGKTNDVDGTWGDWTLQEGENDVFMINNRTGKKFAITMREVS